MSLRTVAEEDLAETLEDKEYGFGWDITVTNPAETSQDLVGRSGDIALLVDPDTGQLVSGRFATVTLRISSLVAAGFTGLPEGVANESSKPWLITFNDLAGTSYTFKVQSSLPDRTLGVVTCTLEAYIP